MIKLSRSFRFSVENFGISFHLFLASYIRSHMQIRRKFIEIFKFCYEQYLAIEQDLEKLNSKTNCCLNA